MNLVNNQGFEPILSFVRVWVDRAVQPELLTVGVDHLFVNCNLIRRNCRDRL
jgi:hypothetical protein